MRKPATQPEDPKNSQKGTVLQPNTAPFGAEN
jgi:hypothetical protein